MTSGERRALAFLAGIGVLGGVARVVAAPARAVTPADRAALRDQIGAVDSARHAAQHARDTRHAPRRSRAAPVAAAIQSAPRGADTPIDVDVADAAALERLPGVGPALARRIVADRDAHGAFGSLDGLQRVRGVGPKLARRVESRVTFSGVSRPPVAGVVPPP